MSASKFYSCLLVLILLALPAWGQNLADFPGAVLTEEVAGLAHNFDDTVLVSPIDDTTLSIPVGDASTFPNSGIIGIGRTLLDLEFIRYCSKSGNTLTACSPNGRGFDELCYGTSNDCGGFPARSHNTGALVRFRTVAHQLNQLIAEVIAIETALGANLANVGGKDITDFGAVSGGAAGTNTTAIQAAIDATPVGGVVYCPPGTFDIDAALTISDSLTFTGAGPGVCVIRTTDATQGCFVITEDNPVHFENFDITSTVTKTAGTCITVDGSTAGTWNQNSTFQNLRITNQWQAFDFIDANLWNITIAYITTRSRAIEVSNTVQPDAGDWVIEGVTIDEVAGSAPVDGIFLESAGGGEITDFKSIGYDNVIHMSVPDGVTTSNLNITEVSIEGYDSRAILLERAGTTGSWGRVIIDGPCQLAGDAGTTAIEVVNLGVQDVQIAGCHIQGGANGIVFSSDHALITDNLFTTLSGTGIDASGGLRALIRDNEYLGLSTPWATTANTNIDDLGFALTHANLPAALADGSRLYCSNCTKGSDPCTAAGTGSMVARLNGAYSCYPGGGASLTVEEADGTPTISNVNTIQFGQATGMTVTDETGGQVQVDLAGIPTSSLGFDPIEETELDLESELETQLTDVTNVFTNNDTIGDANVDDGITLTNITQITTRDHGALQDLTADDHTQYALLAGRATGQVLQGGTAASETLTLESTANVTKGIIIAEDSIEIDDQNELRLREEDAGGDNYLGFRAPAAVTTNGICTLLDSTTDMVPDTCVGGVLADELISLASEVTGDLTLAGDVDGAHGSNDLDEVAVEAELEAVLDLADLQEKDIDSLTGQGAWDTAATKATANLTVSGVEVDFEGGAAEGYPRLASSTTPPSTACDAAGEVGRLYLDTDADTDGSVFFCRGASGWKEIDDDGGAGGGNAWSTIGAAIADAAGDTMTVTDSLSIDVITADDPEDLSAALRYDHTLAGNPVLNLGELVFSDDNAGGCLMSEGSVADVNEGRFCFPDTTGADADLDIVTNANPVTSIEGDGLTVSAGTQAVQAADTTISVAAGGISVVEANLVLTDLVALTTDTTGNYVAEVADGTGIDGTAAGEGATYTPTLDTTEVNDNTWGNNTDATINFIFDPTGTTNPRIDLADDVMNFVAGSIQENASEVVAEGDIGNGLQVVTDTVSVQAADTTINVAAGGISVVEANLDLTDLVALTTDTTGNYVASITNGVGITGGDGGSEGAALTLAVDQAADFTLTGTNIAKDFNGVLYTPQFDFTEATTSPADDISAGANTITITCPLGLSGTNANHYIWIDDLDDSPADEYVLITGGTCAGDEASGTIQFTAASAHTGATYTFRSATAGIQEAIWHGDGARLYTPCGTHDVYETITIGNGTTTKSATGTASTVHHFTSWEGCGPGQESAASPAASVIRWVSPSGGGTMVKLAGLIRGVRIENMHLWGNDGAGGVTAPDTLLELAQARRPVLRELMISDGAPASVGIDIYGESSQGLIEHVAVDQRTGRTAANNGGSGILLGDAATFVTQFILDDVRIWHDDREPTYYGLLLGYIDSSQFRNVLSFGTNTTVSTVTCANPVQFDMAADHGLTTGDTVHVYGGGSCSGGGLSPGNYAITVVDPNSFSLDGTNASGTHSGNNFYGGPGSNLRLDCSRANFFPGGNQFYNIAPVFSRNTVNAPTTCGSNFFNSMARGDNEDPNIFANAVGDAVIDPAVGFQDPDVQNGLDFVHWYGKLKFISEAGSEVGNDQPYAMFFNDDGRVLIGGASSESDPPDSILHLQDTGGSTSGVTWENSNEQFQAYFTTDAASSNFAFTYAGSGGNDLVIESTGAIIPRVEVDYEASGSNSYPRLLNDATPDAADCNEASESGRLVFDTDAAVNEKLWICLGAGGWERVGGAGGGGFTSFDIDGDNNSPQTITDGNEALFVGGLGIDTTAAVTDQITFDFDGQEIGDETWLDNADRTWTFDIAAAGVNPTLAFAASSIEADAHLTIDNQQELRLKEGDGGGENYVGFAAPATITANGICTLLDSTTDIVPDTCVGGILADELIAASELTGEFVDSNADIATDVVNLDEIDDGADTPIAGEYLRVAAGATDVEYIAFNAGTDPTADLEEETHASEHTAGGNDIVTVDGVDAGAATTRSNENKIQIASHDTDCTSLTDGVRGELCIEEDSENLYSCQPTAGGCDTAGEWILTGDGTGGGNSFGVIGAATADAGNDTITVTDSATIDFTTTNDPEDLTADFLPAGVGTATWLDNADRTWSFDIAAAGVNPTLAFAASSIEADAHLTIDDEQELRLKEEDAGGENYIGFKAPAAVTSNGVCTLLDSTTDIVPDTCVGGILADELIAAAELTGEFVDSNADVASDVINLDEIDDAADTPASNQLLVVSDAATTDVEYKPLLAEAGNEITVTLNADDITLDVNEANLDLASIGGTLGTGQAASAFILEGDIGTGLEVVGGTVNTLSQETGFLDDLGAGDLTCGGTNTGRVAVNDADPLQYCDGAATSVRRVAAYGADDGDALAGDSATGFFDAGTVDDARIDGSAEEDEISLANLLEKDIDSLTGQANWGSAVTKETADLIINGVEVDFEAGAAEGYPRLAQSTTPPAGDCDAAAEAGRLYFDSDLDTDGSVVVCRGAAGWKDIDDDGAGGGNAFGTIGTAVADAGSDTITVTDSATIDFTTTDNPEDLTAIVIADSIGTAQVDETQAFAYSGLGNTVVADGSTFGIGGGTVDDLFHVEEAVDGVSVLALLENSQAHAAASTNEEACLDFGFGGDNEVARICAVKEDDYDPGPAENDSALTFHIDTDGTRAEQVRIDSAGRLGIGTNDPQTYLDIQSGVTQDRFVGVGDDPSNPGNCATTYGYAGSSVGQGAAFINVRACSGGTPQFLFGVTGNEVFRYDADRFIELVPLAGANPTAAGDIAYNSTANLFEGGINGTNDEFVMESTTQTLDSKTLDADNNTIIVPNYTTFTFAGCDGATAYLGLNDPGAGETSPTAACNDTGNIQRPSANYSGSAVNCREVTFPLPPAWNSSKGIDFLLRYASTAASPTGNVEWDISTVCRAAGETWDGTFNTAQTITDAQAAQNTLNDATQASLTTTGCAADEDFTIKICRNGTNDSSNDIANALWFRLEIWESL